jgi:hypothetical protein
MRLINATTLSVTAFVSDLVPPYAIVSHTWGTDEVSFEDLSKPWVSWQNQDGFLKIKYSCLQAVKDGLEWVWLDT